MRDLTCLEYWLLMFVIGVTSWQFIWFFRCYDGRYQKWRLRKAVDNIYNCINRASETLRHPALAINYKKKYFEIGIIEEKVNYYYKYYHIFINGDEAAKYHCLKHCFLNSYELEMLNGRWDHEVIEIIHAGNKQLKKREKEANEGKVPSWKEKSYFN